jgi:proteasome lid subunit RPN8/RPN11
MDVYASFHTHPKGCPARPSSMDLAELFTGHPVNYIWAPQEDELNRYTFVKRGKLAYWDAHPISL